MQTPDNNKKGYTEFYNDIFDSLIASKFGALEIRVILAIVRRTYGYHKPIAKISLRMFGKMIKTNHGNVSKVIDRLVENEIIDQIKGPTINNRKTVHKYAINEESLHRWYTRKGLSSKHKKDVSGTPIKDKKKNIKERFKRLVDKMKMN